MWGEDYSSPDSGFISRFSKNCFKRGAIKHKASINASQYAIAWGLQIPVASVQVTYDRNDEELIHFSHDRREPITGCRDALSGYQRGHCFYCNSYISVESGSDYLADVDHLVPYSLRTHLTHTDVNGVWNLVLACTECNRGSLGKFDRLPDLSFLESLHVRNEYYIASNHPLKETIINQTGSNTVTRQSFLIKTWNNANKLRPTNEHWKPPCDFNEHQ